MNMNEELRKVSILRAERDRLLERVARLTAERDDAREQAERWEDDALRLIKERNDAMEERDAARREVCYASTKPPRECAEERGWDCWDRKDFCDKL
jgi:hypothetical protein